MRANSSLSVDQRSEAVALFEAGYGRTAVAVQMQVGKDPIRALYDRWRLNGSGALVNKPTKKAYSFEFKRDVVLRAVAGETKSALAQEFDLTSPALSKGWLRTYRAEREDGLRPEPKGRPRGAPGTPASPESELQRLQRENQRLRAENAYLGKLRALRNQGRR